MKRLAALLIALFLCSCTGPKHVSVAEFKKQHATIGMAQTMKNVTYLGTKDGRAYIKISSMSLATKKWSDELIYVELAELDPAFRDALPKKEMKE